MKEGNTYPPYIGISDVTTKSFEQMQVKEEASDIA